MSGGSEIARLFAVESPATQNQDRTWEHGLLLRGKRLELLAGNIANADTPNYKARDFISRKRYKKPMRAPKVSR